MCLSDFTITLKKDLDFQTYLLFKMLYSGPSGNEKASSLYEEAGQMFAIINPVSTVQGDLP